MKSPKNSKPFSLGTLTKSIGKLSNKPNLIALKSTSSHPNTTLKSTPLNHSKSLKSPDRKNFKKLKSCLKNKSSKSSKKKVIFNESLNKSISIQKYIF
jgi:hypothetical protein